MPVINSDHSLAYPNRNIRYDGAVIGAQDLGSFSRSWTNTRITATNPRWRQEVREQRNATRAYSVSRRDFFRENTRAYGTFYDPSKDFGKIVTYYVDQRELGVTPSDPNGFSTSQSDYRARQEFVNKYRSRRTAFQSGVFFGELMETVRMIRRPAQALREGINRYHSAVKKRLKRSKNKHRTVRDTWLEYNYGWAPLVSDIEDIAKLATLDPFRVSKPIRGLGGSAWNAESGEVNRAPGTIGGPLFWTARYRTVNQVSIQYLGAVCAENTPPSFPEQLGLSWSNVLPTIWELIPYSFLVDYFTNVGKVIEGISTGPIWLAWGCKTTKLDSKATYETLFRPDITTAGYGSTKWSGYVSGHGTTGRYFEMRREAIEKVSVGITDFTFKLPGSGTKWLNIAALARLRR